MHPYFKDYGRDMPRVTKKFFTGAISGFVIYLIAMVVIFYEEIDAAFVELSSLILTDKALANTISILLVSVVAYFVYKISKKHS